MLTEECRVIPYDRVTILRNRARVRDLRVFRDLVEAYFDAAGSAEDRPAAWEDAREVRSRINRLLPRIIEIVHAAGLDTPAPTTDLRPLVTDVSILRNIFSDRSVAGTEQEILDLVDMALGVYEATRATAFFRTVNPLHYAVRLLAYVAGVPRRVLIAFGLWPERSHAPRLRPADLARLQAVASRLADVEGLIEQRFAEVRDRQAQLMAAYGSQVEELHERLDFTERVLAQRESSRRIATPEETGADTPA